MLRNYIKIAWRNLWKQKMSSFINIFGLSVGIAFTLLVAAYVWGEFRVNHQLKDVDNQYIIQSKWKDPNMGMALTSIAELPKALKEVYPRLIKNFYRFDGISSNVSRGDRLFRENIQIGDSSLLEMYGFNLLQGSTRSALSDPFSVVISGRAAIKYFGRKDVVGQLLNIENFVGERHDFKISGVLDDLSKNSVTSLNAANACDLFVNIDAGKYFKRTISGWENAYIVDYVELQKGVNIATVENAMRLLLRKNAPEQISTNLHPFLLALKDYNLNAPAGLGGSARIMTSTLSCIAFVILLIAIINFVNICIGQASGRMKEMGIRKVMGSLRKQLIWQFLTESILTVLSASIFSFFIYCLARPYFSDMLGTPIPSLLAFPPYFAPIVLMLSLLVGVLAGTYPALILSALKSVDSLKGKFASVKEGVLFRRLLVMFQFSTAVIVLIAAFIITQQVSLFFSSNLGYNKDYVLYAPVPRDWSVKGTQKMESIREQLARMPQVKSVTLSYEIPNGNNGGDYQVYTQGGNSAQAIVAVGLVADNQYASTYAIHLKAGEFFKPVFNIADTGQVVINETLSKALGFKNVQDAVGQKILFQGRQMAFSICGVVADFHFGSMQQRIPPMTFTNVRYALSYRYFSIKLTPGNIQQSISALKQKWSLLMPGSPFEYHFMDEALKNVYAQELQLKQAVYLATVLALIIVLLGVLGLISLTIQKRIKEIGIRKVLGSSNMGIIFLFLNDLASIISVAILIACPLAYLIMQKWLSNYAYKIEISLLPFIFSSVLLTAITACLIVLQTTKAALTNPIKSLRTE